MSRVVADRFHRRLNGGQEGWRRHVDSFAGGGQDQRFDAVDGTVELDAAASLVFGFGRVVGLVAVEEALRRAARRARLFEIARDAAAAVADFQRDSEAREVDRFHG